MKKFLSAALSAILCTCLASNAVSAASITIEPQYPLHGNMCGTLNITSEVNRELLVEIEQVTQEGNYVYYKTTIPAANTENVPDTYSFSLEGKNDVSYNITFSSAKYPDCEELVSFNKTFTISDTDFITSNEINGYSLNYSIYRNDDLTVPSHSDLFSETYTDENKIQYNFFTVEIPLFDLIMGDATGDNIINIFDAVAVAKYTVGKQTLTDASLKAADYDKNGNVNIFDAVEIAKSAL